MIFCVQMEMDLKLLECMLDCNCDSNNRVNESTYIDVIRKWVNTIRVRTAHVSQGPAPLEVSGATI